MKDWTIFWISFSCNCHWLIQSYQSLVDDFHNGNLWPHEQLIKSKWLAVNHSWTASMASIRCSVFLIEEFISSNAYRFKLPISIFRNTFSKIPKYCFNLTLWFNPLNSGFGKYNFSIEVETNLVVRHSNTSEQWRVDLLIIGN